MQSLQSLTMDGESLHLLMTGAAVSQNLRSQRLLMIGAAEVEEILVVIMITIGINHHLPQILNQYLGGVPGESLLKVNQVNHLKVGANRASQAVGWIMMVMEYIIMASHPKRAKEVANTATTTTPIKWMVIQLVSQITQKEEYKVYCVYQW